MGFNARNKILCLYISIGKGKREWNRFKGKKKKKRRCRGSNPGHPRDRREYLPLYYNDHVGGYNATKIIQIKVEVWRPTLGKRTRESVIYIPFGT